MSRSLKIAQCASVSCSFSPQTVILCSESTSPFPTVLKTKPISMVFFRKNVERKAPPQKAPSFDNSPEELLRETVTILEYLRSIRDQIAHSVSPPSATFENVIIPLAQDDNTKADHLKIFVFLGSVSTSSELREASRNAEKLIHRQRQSF